VTPQELRERLAAFARDVAVFARPLFDRLETQDIARQLTRAAASVAEHHRAAGRGRSHAEFTSKIGTALQEADEAVYWLEHLKATGFVRSDELDDLLARGRENVAILTSSVRTARRNARRGK
jgi:four helix bundle protein